MKKFLMPICLLSVLVVFSGCVGKGFVIGSMDAAMSTSSNPPITIDITDEGQPYEQQDDIVELAVTTDQQPVSQDHIELIQYLQSEILGGLSNFSILPNQADMYLTDSGPGANMISDNTEAKTIAGHVALTFDDGPHPTLTPMLLDALYARDIRVTFFLLGLEVDRHPHIVARMYEEGHSVGNHSYYHPSFTGLSRQRILDEIELTNRAIEAATGSQPTLLRPPYGRHNSTVIEIARELDMSVVMWSVDPRDWEVRNVLQVRDNIVNHSMDGSVVVLHDIHPTSIEATIMAIDYMMEKGYVFVTVEELFGLSDISLYAGEIYRGVYHSLGGN
ncbi:MAG: polysaccharide deacetylase family protein [Defluviitaleaceae bacterium]|nr:polysaccharide deacetylase family protein [Defluviitaleaceae bacterium]